jgi:hypothetical protein
LSELYVKGDSVKYRGKKWKVIGLAPNGKILIQRWEKIFRIETDVFPNQVENA